MSTDLMDSDLEPLPPELYHQSQHGEGPPKTDRYGINLTTPPRRWEDWVVKLKFNKLGRE